MVKANQNIVGHCDTRAKIYQRSTFASSGQTRRIQQHLKEFSFDFCKCMIIVKIKNIRDLFLHEL